MAIGTMFKSLLKSSALKKWQKFLESKIAVFGQITTKEQKIIFRYILINMPSKLHPEILTKEQKGLLHLVKSFNNDFGLVGGTAIALYIGHRESIDFDLFSLSEFENHKIRAKIVRAKRIARVLRDETGQYTVEIGPVKLTFFQYMFRIDFSVDFEGIIKMPDLLTLAAMKAYALGRRAKWKDYVDLYFTMQKYHGIKKIVEKAKQIYKTEFNEKLFRSQLAYFKDINYSEEVIYMPGMEIKNTTIEKGLIDFSLS